MGAAAKALYGARMTIRKEERRPVLPAVFDESQGFWFSPEEVPVQWGEAPDHNPVAIVTVDGHEIVCAEKTAWTDDDSSGPAPHRIVAFLAFSGIAVSDTKMLLHENLGTHGLPAWGLDEEGDLTLSASVIVGENIPLDVTRRQLLVCLGLISEAVEKILDAVNAETPPESKPPMSRSTITRRFLAAL